MSSFRRGGATIHFDLVGHDGGELVIATHGFAENAAYWTVNGVADRIAAAGYRLALMDMRGHGRTVVDDVDAPAERATAETISDDIDGLADHLGASRFHLLSHATGGMAAARYAMRSSERLLSLIITDAGSATQPYAPGTFDGRAARSMWERWTWDDALESMRAKPGIFLGALAAHPDRDRLWPQLEAMFRQGDTTRLGWFAETFYDDEDPHVDRLRTVGCPTLVLVGSEDKLFVQPSELLAREIPDCRQVVLEGIGHMTTFEAPEETVAAITSFLSGAVARPVA